MTGNPLVSCCYGHPLRQSCCKERSARKFADLTCALAGGGGLRVHLHAAPTSAPDIAQRTRRTRRSMLPISDREPQAYQKAGGCSTKRRQESSIGGT